MSILVSVDVSVDGESSDDGEWVLTVVHVDRRAC